MERIEPVAAYIRVSSDEQRLHGLSLDAQKMKLNNYAKEHDMNIVEWYMDEGVSGRKPIRKRPELQRMIFDAKKGNFKRILFIKLDRFFRSVAEYHECMKQIAPVVWTTTDEQYDLTTANGRMFVNMKLTIAELEADQTGERIKIVNEYKVATGQPLIGNPPFGWKIEKDSSTGRKKVVKDLDQAPILEDVIKHFLTYQSKRKTITYLYEKYQITMSQHSFSALISNTMLCGAYRDNPSYCDAYIDRETFDKIQSIIKRNIKENTAENRVYLFTGLIKCPNCGRLLSGGMTSTIVKGNPYKYKTYRCPKHRSNNACDFSKAVFEVTLENMLLENLEQYVKDARLRVLDISKSERWSAKNNVDELTKEIERLNYAWRKGRIKTIEQYDQDYDKLMERLEIAKREQEEISTVDLSNVEAVLQSDWRNIYNSLTDEHKRAFWRNIISSIELEWHDNIKRVDKINFI